MIMEGSDIRQPVRLAVVSGVLVQVLCKQKQEYMPDMNRQLAEQL